MKKLYIAAIGATMALSLLFAACGAKDNMPNTTTSTTSRTTSTTATTSSTTSTTLTTNMLEEGVSDASSKLSEAGSDIKSELNKMP
ncbi:MAG: hypothetical protein J6L91_06735 [Clostridia bacterium]|nr:hypothetical protein [Clostridia bacterium]